VSNFAGEDRAKVEIRREYPERPLVGVGGVVVGEQGALLVRRGRPPLEGEWSIPGGMLEVGETILEGVRRELAEETGLDVRVLDLIEIFERISLDAEGKPKYHFVVLDYYCEVIAGNAQAGSDAREVTWVKEGDLGNYALAASAQRVIQKAFGMARQREAHSK
jgi:8-oxo-dGTP diphosphatase